MKIGNFAFWLSVSVDKDAQAGTPHDERQPRGSLVSQTNSLRKPLYFVSILLVVIIAGLVGFFIARDLRNHADSHAEQPPSPSTAQLVRPFDQTRIPPAMQLPHENDGDVSTKNMQWDLPSGCTDDSAIPGDDTRLDTRDVQYTSPGGREHWQIAVYHDERSAIKALIEMRARETCTGAQGPPIDITLGNQGFARNYYEGGPESTRGAHWVGVRVSTAVLLLNLRLDPDHQRDLRTADQHTVQMAADVIADLCGWGWRC